MKDKNYASFIISKIDNREDYQRLENYILNKFEYSEIILLYDKDYKINNIREELNPKSDNILCLNLADNNEDSKIRAGLEFSKGDIRYYDKDALGKTLFVVDDCNSAKLLELKRLIDTFSNNIV